MRRLKKSLEKKRIERKMHSLIEYIIFFEYTFDEKKDFHFLLFAKIIILKIIIIGWICLIHFFQYIILSYFQPIFIKPLPLRIPSYTNIPIPLRKMKPRKKKSKNRITSGLRQ